LSPAHRKSPATLPRLSGISLAVVLSLYGPPAAAARNAPIVVAESEALQSSRSIGVNQEGGFVVVWGGPGGIGGRCYGSGRTALGEAFVIDADSADQAPSVAMNAGGGFVVVWQAGNAIVARRYSGCGSDGVPAGNPDVTVADSGSSPSVALDRSGNFAVAWFDGADTGSAERFDAQDQPQGLAITFPASAAPSIAMDPTPDAASEPNGGRFVIAAPGDGALTLRRYQAGGTEDGTGLEVAADSSDSSETGADGGPYPWITTDTEVVNTNPSVAMDGNGEFVIGWEQARNDRVHTVRKVKNKPYCYTDDYGKKTCQPPDEPYDYPYTDTYGSSSSIKVRRYDATGAVKDKTRKGEDKTFAVSGKARNRVQNGAPSVAMHDTGNFAVGWTRTTFKTVKGKCTKDEYGYEYCADDTTTYFADVKAQAYKASGKRQGGTLNVSGRKKVVDGSASVALDETGDLLVGWRNDLAEKTKKTKNRRKCTNDPDYGKTCNYYDADGNQVYDKYSYSTTTLAEAAVSAKRYRPRKR
jgi:hypothetical protein